jgi:hypothetical protein
MPNKLKASRDVIARTGNWSEALKFYESVLGLPIANPAARAGGGSDGTIDNRLYGPSLGDLAQDLAHT